MEDRIHRETNLVQGDVIRDIIWEYHISVRVELSHPYARGGIVSTDSPLPSQPQATVSHLPAHEVEKWSEGRKHKDALSRHAIGGLHDPALYHRRTIAPQLSTSPPPPAPSPLLLICSNKPPPPAPPTTRG
jgi:hypothetical protein